MCEVPEQEQEVRANEQVLAVETPPDPIETMTPKELAANALAWSLNRRSW